MSALVTVLLSSNRNWFSNKIFKEKGLSHKLIFAVIPLVLGYHLGHNLMHVLSEISYLVPLVNDPFGFGWDLFGFREFKPRSLMDHNTIIMFQLAFICVGFYYSVKILNIRIENLTRTLVNSLDRRAVYFSQYAFLLIIGLISVWFVFQPMVMRSQY